MAEKIVLIDGHSILNRAFYGVPDLTNAEGLHTNAVYGFLNIMFKVLDEEKPEYLVVTFDVHAPTFRHKMYAEYKGTRKPMAEELRQQVPVIKEVLQAMGIYTIEQAGLEADDLLGTLSKRCESLGMEVAIISGDRDTLQLATEHTMIRIPKTKQGRTEVEDYHAAEVQECYGVTPTEFIDVKALMGDTSDNIPGVPGVGEKTATKIIQQYGSIENAYAHAAEIKPPRASKNLQEFWEQAQMSKTLATIETNADITFDLEQAHYDNPYTKEAYEIFQRLQFKNLLSRFDVEASVNDLENHFHEIQNRTEAEKIFARAGGFPVVGVCLSQGNVGEMSLLECGEEYVQEELFDMSSFGESKPTESELTEKEQTESKPAKSITAAIAFGTEVYACFSGADLTMEELFRQVSKLSERTTLAMFDWKRALPFLTISKEENCFDNTVAAYLLNPLKNDYTFEDVAREQLNLMIDPQVGGSKKDCYEAYVAMKSTEPLQKKLANTEMDRLFREVEMPLVFTLYHMERNGVRVEAEALKIYGDQLGERIVELEQEIYDLAGETFNINSPKQLGMILFDHMHLPNGKKTKTGYSTAADVLEKLAPDYPIVSKILEYRQLAKLKSTYADGLANFIGSDGRIHGKFNQTITATGRISSTEPNLQKCL